jgi:transposase-like protein
MDPKKTAHKYSPDFIAKMLKELQDSGVSIDRFAKRTGISKTALYRWRRLARAEAKPAAPKLLPVTRKPEASLGASLVLELPGGARLTVPPAADLMALAQLLKAL